MVINSICLYSLNETELRYAQIEKEALVLVYTCEKFSEYIYVHSRQVNSP